MVLAIVEAMLEKYAEDKELAEYVRDSLQQMLKAQSARPEENQYEIIWLIYFLKIVLREKINYELNSQNPFVNSLVNEKQQFYCDFTDGGFFEMPNLPIPRNHLLYHLAIFRAKQADEETDDEE